MVALVDDHLTVVLDQRHHLPLAGQGLHHGYIDPAGWLGLAASNGADHTLNDTQKGLQPLLPLLRQLSAMHQHQGVDTPARDHRGGSDRLAESCWGAQYASIKG